jgi:hypothetical protein
VYPNLGGPYTLKSRLNYRDNPIDGQWERMPGPGAYNPNDRVLSTRDRGAGKSGFSMGVRHSRYVMPLITGADMYY